MALKIGLAVAAVLLLFLAFVATRPSDFTVTRSTTISAPAAAVFPLVNDFHAWTAWSPWEGIDPNMKRTYSGSPSGKGAEYAWVGNDKVGEGKMAVLESAPNERVTIRLEFLKPWQATNQTVFSFKSEGNATAVTWAMSGHNNFMMKAVTTFMNMDKMVGGDFERGLGNLKAKAEAEPPAN